jgi:hypothetical protein
VRIKITSLSNKKESKSIKHLFCLLNLSKFGESRFGEPRFGESEFIENKKILFSRF